MQATAKRHVSDFFPIQPDETICEFLERVVSVRLSKYEYSRSGYEIDIANTHVITDIAGYRWDDQCAEQPEPADGAEFRFSKFIGGPFCSNFSMLARAYREDDEVVFEVELV